jgi:hypothetical protein
MLHVSFEYGGSTDHGRIPVINDRGDFGCWVFIEIDGPWNATNTVDKGE